MLEPADVRGVVEGAEKDAQTVTLDGVPLRDPIVGVETRRATVQADERGTLVEIFDARWGFADAPVPFVYHVTLAVGSVRGWVVHLKQDDRMFVYDGVVKVSLYDARKASESFGRVNVFHLGAHAPTLLTIPAGVFHAVKNVGQTPGAFVNLPSRPYDHADPDKHRLPIDTDLIPYRV